MNKTKKEKAIEEIKELRKKLHLYTEENRDLVEKRIKELVKKFSVTYGDIWRKHVSKSSMGKGNRIYSRSYRKTV